MQSSFKVINGHRIIEEGDSLIETKYDITKKEQNIISQNVSNEEKTIFDNLSMNILQNAKITAQNIITEAITQAEEIKNDTYNKAYAEGNENGYNEGYNIGYNEAMEKANIEGKEIILRANEVLFAANREYENYFNEVQERIKETIVEIGYEILKREIKEKDALNSMVQEALEDIKNSKTIILRCNNIYSEELKSGIELWKAGLGMKDDIFVIEDNSLGEGEVVIQKDNGKVILNTEYGFEKIKEAILSEG